VPTEDTKNNSIHTNLYTEQLYCASAEVEFLLLSTQSLIRG